MKHEVTETPAGAPNGTIVSAAAAALYVHDANPRDEATVTEAEIAALADSIERCGLLQNLIGLLDEDGERIGIVAGGRRTRAILLMAEQGRGDGPYMVRIAPDLATATEWANVENNARANPQPADEIMGYAAMAAKGASIGEIAIANAVSEAHVRRRLKLAALPEDAMKALREGRISLKAAEIMTTANDTDRITAALAEIEGGRGFNEYHLRQFLNPESIGAGDRRVVFIGLDEYKAAGGRTTEDLFSEDVVIHDVAKVDEMFAAKLAEAVEAATAEGWKWVESIEEAWFPYGFMDSAGRIYPEEGELTEDESAEYDELADLAEAEAITEEGEARLAALQAILDGDYTAEQKAHSGAILYVDNNGALESRSGLIRKEDKAEAIKAGVLPKPYRHDNSGAEDKPKPVHSAKLQEDLNAIRLAAAQSALVEKPETVLDLLAFALSPDSGYYNRVMDVRLDGQRNHLEDPEGFAPDQRIITGLSAAYLGDERPDADGTEAERFAAFRAEGRKHRNALLAAKLAKVFNFSTKDGDAFGAVETELGAGMRDVWTPTAANFFKRVGASYLDDIYLEVFDAKPGADAFKAFSKQKKGAKADWLEKLFSGDEAHAQLHGVTPAIRDRVNRWTPKAD
ncbi:MAG: ParB N-terminal domain-containing protein [Pseudomonadota bacterium]